MIQDRILGTRENDAKLLPPFLRSCSSEEGDRRSVQQQNGRVWDRRGRASKMSMDGWWMVQTTVRPVLTVLRTVRITIAAARASRPLVGSSCRAGDSCQGRHAAALLKLMLAAEAWFCLIVAGVIAHQQCI